jgi:hypothetical protein
MRENEMSLKILMGIAFVLLLFSYVSAVPTQKVYILTLKYSDGAVSKEGLYVTKGFYNPSKEEGDWLLEVISFGGEVLYSQKFGFHLERYYAPSTDWFDEDGKQIYIPSEEESVERLSESVTDLAIPYFENAEKMNIYDKNKAKVLEIDISVFSESCGDGKCQFHESFESCPKDCGSGLKDDYCDRVEDGICDPDCKPESLDPDCTISSEKEVGKFPWAYIILIALLVVVLLVLVIRKISRKSNEWDQLYQRY